MGRGGRLSCLVVVVVVALFSCTPPVVSGAAHFSPDARTTARAYREETLAAHGCGPAHSRGTVPHDWARNHSHANLLFGDGPLGDDVGNPSLGNGYLAWRAGSPALFISGVYNGPSQSANPSHAAKFPSPLNFSVAIGSDEDYRHGSGEEPYLRPVGTALDMRYGRVIHRSEYGNGDGGVVVEQEWFAHRSVRSVIAHRTTLTTCASCDSLAGVTLSAANSAPGTTDFDFLDAANVRCPRGALCAVGVTSESETWNSPLVRVAYVGTDPGGGGGVVNGLGGTAHLRPGDSFFAVAAVRTSLDAEDPLEAATADYLNATGSGFESLSASNRIAWDTLRAEGGIEVDCAPLAQALNTSAYNILISARADWPYSLSPQALPEGEGDDPSTYHRHVFWDCETWQLPHLTVFHPSIARSVLRYRFDRREGAREKAISYGQGWTGTMFPWESAFTGVETCPTWAITGLLEQHITADIGVAVWQAWRAWRDDTWLVEIGAPLLSGIAEFWASRTSPGGHVANVIPPDEYAINITDSVYTNSAAALALSAAVKAARIAGSEPDPKWSETEARLVVLYNETLGIHPEYQGYSGQLIKQADVILMGFPLMVPGMPKGARARDLVYYSNRTDPNGPAMTWGMVAVGLLEMSDEESEIHGVDPDLDAAGVYRRSYANIAWPFGVWFEVPGRGGAGNFITGAGGFLQGTLGGYGGIRLRDETMDISPRCPPGVQNARYRGVSFAGARFDISVTAASGSGSDRPFMGSGNATSTASVTLGVMSASASVRGFTVTLPGAAPVKMEPGRPVTVPVGSVSTITVLSA